MIICFYVYHMQMILQLQEFPLPYWMYLQAYGYAVDAQKQRPSLKLEYAIAAQGAQPEAWRDVSASVHYAGQYCRVARMVSLSRLQPGEHTLFLRIRDNISGQAAAGQATFRITN